MHQDLACPWLAIVNRHDSPHLLQMCCITLCTSSQRWLQAMIQAADAAEKAAVAQLMRPCLRAMDLALQKYDDYAAQNAGPS